MNPNIREAERIAGLLAEDGAECLVIGAVALAAHGYIRFTRDVDLGVDAGVSEMVRLTSKLRANGYDALFHEPDGDDPLGGVIDIEGPFGLVQIVSFGGRFPAAIRDGLAGEGVCISSGSCLRVAPIPQLVALKLYAGGLKSLADVVELLRRNPSVDLSQIAEVCRRYRIRGWGRVMEELKG